MPLAERSATARWEGNLTEGKGRFTVASGAIEELPITWAARTVRSDGKTSPEELIAAAHASCFSMALASDLNKAGSRPELITATATCTLDRIDGKLKITTMDIYVKGRVPDIDAETFQATADGTGRNCPVSGALIGNVQINVHAELE